MTYLNTPINGVEIPNNDEKIVKAYEAVQKLGTELELFTVMRFANMTSLAAKLVGASAPVNGMVAYVVDIGQLLIYTGGAWHRVYPVEKQVFTGTTAPATSLGAVGDIYFQF